MAMKFALAALLGLSCFTGAVGMVAKTRGPIQKVTDLLKEMHDQLQQDEKVEQKLYNKYACWCETATEKKAKAIEDAQTKLRELSQLILTLKGEIATLEAEIQELERKLEENAKMQEEATEIRAKQNQEYLAFTAETKQALKALQEAIEVLIEGASGKPSEAAFLQTQGRQVVKKVINALPGSAKVKDDQVAFLSEFLNSESRAKYTPQSMTVQGILKDMYETFADDVETATMTEAKQNRDYEKLIADLIALANQMKKEKKEKEELKAEKEVNLADASEEYDATEEQMEADIEFFDETKEACEFKHAEWTKRSDLRQEEIAGIAKAIEYLSDDENRELLDSAIEDGKETMADTMRFDTGADLVGKPASFLQVAATESPEIKAFEALKAKASTAKSLRLAALAARVHEAKAGHFEAVIKSIDDMIQTLKEEETADIAKRDQCKAEIQESNSTILQLKWDIKCNKAKIEKLAREIEDRQEEIKKASEEIKETEQFIKDITAVREQENSDFKEAKKTDQEAIDLLVKVRNVLTSYYDNNNITMGPIQGAVKGLELNQKRQDPVFKRSRFEAPAAVFSGKDKRADESKAIVSILQMVIQDLNDEIANDMKAEEKAQLSYEAQKHAAEMYIAKLKAKIVFLEGVIATLEKEKADETTLMNNNNILLEDEEKYLDGILPDCEWVFKAFYDRADRRAAEMNGLTTAKAYLVGYNPKQDTVGYIEDEGASRYNVAPSQSLLQLRR